MLFACLFGSYGLPAIVCSKIFSRFETLGVYLHSGKPT